MIESSDRRITFWVGRLLAINAIVLLLQQTIFTSNALADAVSFSSSLALQRPWTFITYMFVHGGILHLAANSLALFVFGPTVERHLGGRAFITYYFLCGIGAALLLGGYFGWKSGRGNQQKKIEEKNDPKLKLVVIHDSGKQTIHSADNNQPIHGLQLKIIPDKGVQIIKTN